MRDVYGNDTLTIYDFAELVVQVIKEVHQIDISIKIPIDSKQSENRSEPLQFSNVRSTYKPEGSIRHFIRRFSKMVVEDI